MPYGISENQPDCSAWAAVVQREDGSFETLACYETKQETIDRMVAQSLAEELEPLGEVGARALPDNYRPALTNDVPEGRACGNCAFYNEAMIVGEDDDDDENGVRAYCTKWDDYVRGDFYCNAWQPENERIEQRQISLIAPDFMQTSARRGLRLHEEGFSGDGLVPATVADARRMANGEALSEAKWRKIPAWIARHIVDLDAVQGDEITAGLVAMLLWGGGSSKTSARRAQAYAQRIVDRLNEEEERADAPAPPKDQIKGSDENPAGSAADKTGNISLSDAVETSLQNKADEHNKRMGDEDRPAWTRVRVGALRSVWRRGAGAFSSSHRPNMTRQQWAMARVNAFLYLAEKGKPENSKYVGDNDLLHSEHPKYSEADRNVSSKDVICSSSMAELREAIADPTEVRWCVKQADEKRFVAFTNLEARQDGEGNKLIGYASVFDSPSEPMPFVEYVRKGAFAKTLNDGADVRLLIDHEGVPLARTKSGTLMLEEDDRGLRVEASLDPMNPDAARVISAMKRGDISQMSFAFRTIKDNWNTDRSVRELKEVQLYDVSVVTFPAYEETVAEIRSGQAAQETTTITPIASVRLRSAQIALARRHSRD